MKEISIIGVDPGFATMGLARLQCKDGTLRAIAAQRVVTKLGRVVTNAKDSTRKRIRAAIDEDRRMAELSAALVAFIAAGPATIMAYEVYTPHERKDGDDGYTASSGRLVAMSVGLAVGIARAHGLITVGFQAAAAKRMLQAQGKAGVHNRLVGRVDGFAEIVGEDPGYHKSDAFGLAYAGFVTTMRAQR